MMMAVVSDWGLQLAYGICLFVGLFYGVFAGAFSLLGSQTVVTVTRIVGNTFYVQPTGGRS